MVCFFFQAEDGIRDYKVTGVQTCALPISFSEGRACRACRRKAADQEAPAGDRPRQKWQTPEDFAMTAHNSELRADRPGFPGLPRTCRCSRASSAGRRAPGAPRKIDP